MMDLGELTAYKIETLVLENMKKGYKLSTEGGLEVEYWI